MLRGRRSIKNTIKKQKNNESNSSTNDFDKITSLFKDTIYKINKGENEFNDNMNLSFINMVNSYLKDCSCPENKNFYFIRKFNDIIKILSMNKNEFVFWTILIDTYMRFNSNNWPLEALFYIGLYSKEKFLIIFQFISMNINKLIKDLVFGMKIIKIFMIKICVA